MNKTLQILVGMAVLLFLMTSARAEETLTWQECLAEARKNNPELISAAEGILAQKAGKEIVGSSLLPQIGASVDAATSGTSTTTSSGVKQSSTADSYSYGLSATQLIFDGFKSVDDLKAASENIKAAQQAYRFTSSDVRRALRTAFINVLHAQELIKVAEAIVAIRKDSLMLIALQYQSGLEHKGAFLTSEANVAEADFELAQAKRNLVFARRSLVKALGRKEYTPLAVQGDFTIQETAEEKPDLEAIAKNNALVLQAAANRSSALFAVRSAQGAFAPALTGRASASKKNTYWPPDNNQWSVGLGLSMPLFEGGLKFAQLSQARASYNQAVADERSIRDAAVVSLEETWGALQDAIETVTVQQKALTAAVERSRIAEAQYSTGFISFDNWIIIQDGLVSVKKSYLEARSNALRAEAQWIHAKGETLEYAQQ